MYLRETEIRHLSSADVYKLGQILEQTNSWKKLMRIIPKNLSADQLDNTGKYNNDHVRLIENASMKQNRMSTEILFEEWGTSGRKRPTVGNLLELLIKAELFRAADFVALNFLNEPPPERPLKGPAAKVDISIPLASEEIREVERILDETNYPGTRTLLENAQIPSEMNNKDFYEKLTFDDKKVDIVQTDLIKFSGNSIETITDNIPILSGLVCNNDTTAQLLEYSTENGSNANEMEFNHHHYHHHKHNVQSFDSNPNDANIDEVESRDIPVLSVLQTHDDNVNLPDLSALNVNGIDDEDDSQNDSILNDSSSISHDSNITPNLSILDQSGSGLNDSSLTNVTETSDDSSFSCDGKLESDNNIPCISALNN